MSVGGGGLVGLGPSRNGAIWMNSIWQPFIGCLYVLYSDVALLFCSGTLPVVMLLSYWCFAGNRDKEDR